jgi:hypothetical protein
MPCPECGHCPDCNVCICNVDLEDDDQRTSYVARIREGERRRCCDELFDMARTHEKLAREEKSLDMRKVFEKSALVCREHADRLWTHKCF